MENQLSSGQLDQSQGCICCKQKDKIIQNYKKLVELHKTRAKKCNSNVLYAIKTARLNSNRQVLEEIANQLAKPKKLFCLEKQTSNFSETINSQKTQDNGLRMAETMQQSGSKWRPSKIIDSNAMMSTSPAVFFKNCAVQIPKRISLTSQWQSKFTELSSTISQQNERIAQLTNKIEYLNSRNLYTRSIFLNLLKSLQLHNKNTNISNQSKDIIDLILHIFQFSSSQIKIILGNQASQVVEVQTTGNVNVFDRKRNNRLSLIR